MTPFRDIVESLAMEPGVRAAVLAAPDGVVVDSVVHVDVRADAVAAFGMAVLDSAMPVGASTLQSQPRCVVVDAEGARLCLTGNSEVAMILLADRRAPLGRLRLALRRAMEALP